MDLRLARLRMVDEQVAARGVRDARVLEAMRVIERHRFLPRELEHDAYADRPLPIGEGQTISQPYIVAAMSEALAAAPAHRVLEIGTGSGYQSAILSRLAREVISLERHPVLAERARAALAAQGCSNVTVVVADGTEGYPERAPFDRILVTAGAPGVPATLKAQLADGGRLVIPVGPSEFQRLTVIERTGTTFTTREGEGCVFVPLIGRHGWAGPA